MHRRLSIFKFILVTIALAVMLGAVSCSAANSFKDKSTAIITASEECGVYMNVVVKGDREIEVNFENKSNESYIYGNAYSLEYYKDGDWYVVPMNLAFTQEGHLLGPADEFTSDDIDAVSVSPTGSMSHDLSRLGKLPKGHYRIIKDISVLVEDEYGDRYYLAAEFDLEK